MDLSNKKIFVTGATGFIGSALIKRLSQYNCEICVLVRSSSDTSVIDDLGIKKIVGDLTNPETYSKHLYDIDIIYHVAGLVTDWARKKEFQKIIIEGTKKLLENCYKADVKLFIYVSTAEVLQRFSVLHENLPYSTSKLGYTYSKTEADKLVIEFNKRYGLPTIIIRPAWVYGPGEKILIPEIVHQLNGKIFFLVGKKNVRLPIIYIENLIDILILVPTLKLNKGIEILLAADDDKITWRQFISKIAMKLGKEVRFFFIPFPLAYVIGYFLELFGILTKRKQRPLITRSSARMLSASTQVDTSKLKIILSYKQRVSLNDGLNETLQSYK